MKNSDTCFEACGRELNGRGALTVRWATSHDDIERASRLLHQKYFEKGFLGQGKPLGLFFNPHSLSDSNGCLIALDQKKNVVATISFVLDSARFGLPMDALFAEELQPFRNNHLRLGEIHSFAVDEASSAAAGAFALLFRCVHSVAQQNTDVVCHEVHPSHLPIYSKKLGFTPFAETRNHPHLLNAPAVPLKIELKDRVIVDEVKRRLNVLVQARCPSSHMTDENYDAMGHIVHPKDEVRAYYKALCQRYNEPHHTGAVGAPSAPWTGAVGRLIPRLPRLGLVVS